MSDFGIVGSESEREREKRFVVNNQLREFEENLEISADIYVSVVECQSLVLVLFDDPDYD